MWNCKIFFAMRELCGLFVGGCDSAKTKNDRRMEIAKQKSAWQPCADEILNEKLIQSQGQLRPERTPKGKSKMLHQNIAK